MYLVDKIIEKCEHSSRDWREGAAGGRTMKITQEDYDACGKQRLIEEAQKLEAAGLVNIKKWVTFGSDIDVIAYRIEKLPQFYNLAKNGSGGKVWPKQEKVNYYCAKIERELSEGFQKKWIEIYLEKLLVFYVKVRLPKTTY